MNVLPALAIALTVIAAPAAAMAQTSMGSVQITAEGLPHVVAHCETIADMSVSKRADYVPSLSQRVASGIALATVSVSDCRNAGLI